MRDVRRPDPAAGFTMLEILVVLVIVAMAATLVAPAIDAGLRSREVRSTVRTIAGTMRTAQAEAVRTGTRLHMEIDVDRNAIALDGRDAFELAQTVGIGDVRGGEIVGPGLVQVTFYPNGSNTGVEMLVADREQHELASFVVRMNPLIGVVTIDDAH